MVHKFSVKADKGSAPLAIEVEPLGEGRYRLVCEGDEEVLSARAVHRNAHGVTTWSLVTDGGGSQEEVAIEGAAPELRVTLPGGPILVQLADAREAALSAQAGRPAVEGPKELRAPMPGKVVKVLCKAGDKVEAGQGLLLIEAMKMENELRAKAAGTVKELRAEEGQNVEGGAVLVILS